MNDSNPNEVLTRLIRRVLDLTLADQVSLLKRLDAKTKKTTTAGQRQHQRKVYSGYINFYIGDQSCWGLCRDISNGGMYIETDENLSLNDPLLLNVPNSDNTKIMKLSAKVVRRESEGIGVAFIAN